jgi:hypothetical protein
MMMELQSLKESGFLEYKKSSCHINNNCSPRNLQQLTYEIALRYEILISVIHLLLSSLRL